ncbi:DUF305 domain-containing protein [Micromonospora globbae]|jgi:uncharacterized protein (DUF305 family)|uniref:DUF305 domain-containing protein n=1 Tax=Micromonospora globbae TaxID=1894969 RepID=A0A420F733_9ACTN|nr:DUF305 domain-containing protein [Micromonospora globbae]RKF28727.1 DUF305 domain-containing protein [Micromonospora globbae]WTF83947.1 DUF305 domain-containing protein [Micromonospora globbae]
MTGRRARVLAIVTLAIVLPLAVVVSLRARGDEGSAGTPAAAPTSAAPTSPEPTDVTVIVPGRPGEPAATAAPSEVRGAGAVPHNSMDVWFVRMMIPHHTQALEMARLAPERAADPTVRAIADRIRASQGPEIGMMRAWLKNRGLSEEAPGHDHGTMRGMQTPEAMRKLAATRGADFDRLFVQMMTEHHRGAIEMATDLLTVGSDQQLNEFANSVATEQAVEIGRMREILPD